MDQSISSPDFIVDKETTAKLDIGFSDPAGESLNNIQADDVTQDNIEYEKVEDFDANNEEEESDIAEVLATIQLKQKVIDEEKVELAKQPSVLCADEFVRNFLIKCRMEKTFEVFNRELYELQSRGEFPADLPTNVPDVYVRNEELDAASRRLRDQLDKMKQVSDKAQATWDRFRKERDYHRLNHHRVVQEKNKLLNDLRIMRKHLKSYDPIIDELKRRYEVAMKEKALVRIERDRLKARVKALEEQVSPLQRHPKNISDS
jgi:hypothetical protein